MDIFSWSFPFLVEKIMSMFTHILIKLDEIDDENEDEVPLDQIPLNNSNSYINRKNVFKLKLHGYAKMH